MPNYEFECRSCNYSYDRFYSLKDWGKFAIDKIKCDKCGKKEVRKIMSLVGFEIRGWSAGKELARYKQTQLAEECLHEARTKGISRTEMQEGQGLLAEREKQKNLEPGTLSGKKPIRYETKNGKRVLSGNRKSEISKRAKLQAEARKVTKLIKK